MRKETRENLNARIIIFLNRYLKHGNIVKATDPFYARGEIEKMLTEACEEGIFIAEHKKTLDEVIDKMEL